MCRRCRGHCVFLHSYQNRVKQQQMLSPWLALVELVPSLRSVVVFILESMVGNKSNWQVWWKSPRGFSRAQRWAVIFIPEFHEVMGISEIWKRPNREINLLVFNRPTEKNNKKNNNILLIVVVVYLIITKPTHIIFQQNYGYGYDNLLIKENTRY